MPDQTEPWLSPLRVADLKKNRTHPVRLTPGAEIRRAIATALDLMDLRKLRLEGELRPMGRKDWRFEGTLGATVVQPCVVTLEPVTTRIDTPVERNFVMDYEAPDPGSETEMDDDDATEPLGDVIDPGQVLVESLALALPDYPRAESAEPVVLKISEPGVEAMTDEQARPFAGLAALRNKLTDQDPEND